MERAPSDESCRVTGSKVLQPRLHAYKVKNGNRWVTILYRMRRDLTVYHYFILERDEMVYLIQEVTIGRL